MIKKLLLSAMMVLMLVAPAMASKRINTQSLRVNNVSVTSYDITSGATVTSDSVKVNGNVGFTTLLVTEDKVGGAGSVDIYAQYSFDKVTWSRPYLSDMSGTITAEGNIVTALGNATRYIVFTPRMSQWVRFIVSANANSRLTAVLSYQEEM